MAAALPATEVAVVCTLVLRTWWAADQEAPMRQALMRAAAYNGAVVVGLLIGLGFAARLYGQINPPYLVVNLCVAVAVVPWDYVVRSLVPAVLLELAWDWLVTIGYVGQALVRCSSVILMPLAVGGLFLALLDLSRSPAQARGPVLPPSCWEQPSLRGGRRPRREMAIVVMARLSPSARWTIWHGGGA